MKMQKNVWGGIRELLYLQRHENRVDVRERKRVIRQPLMTV